MWDYSEKLKDHFFKPRNVGVLEDANGVGEVGSIACGDALKLMFKVNTDTHVIEDARFQTFGCGSAIAASSALTELIIGKTVDEARKLTNRDIADFLDGLPPEKMHCSVMGAEALAAAVASYRGEAVDDDDHEDGALVCKCFGVDEGMLGRAIRTNKLTTLEQVTFYTKAGGSCATCHEAVEEVLAATNADMVAAGELLPGEAFTARAATAPAPAPAARMASAPITIAPPKPKASATPAQPGAAAGLTPAQEILAIGRVIDEMRGTFKADGGDVALVDVSGDLILVHLTGTCAGCQLAGTTLGGVQARITSTLGRPVRVVPVQQV